MSGTQAPANIVVPGYPANNLVPGFYAAFDPSQANTAGVNQQTLIIGQVTSASTLTPNVPVILGDLNTMQAATGNLGSMLSLDIARYRKGDTYGTVYVLPLQDASGATATVQTVTITGPATAAGTISDLIDGQTVNVGVNVGDTATVMATNYAAAVNAIPTLPVTATSAAGVVTLTAKNLGLTAGDISIYHNWYGSAGGQATPAGVTLIYAVTTQGATNPTLTTALANLGTTNFDFIVCGYTDTQSLNALSAFLSQSSGRWSLFNALYGMVWTAFKGTLSTRTTLGTGRNDQFITCLGMPLVPFSAHEIAADYAAAGAVSIRNNPALPLQTLAMTVLAPSTAFIDTVSEQQTLLSDGISTYTVDSGGTVRIQRAVSFYQTNANGQPDNSWRDVPKTYTLMSGVRQMISSLSSQFARKALVADGTNVAGGTSQVTSKTILNAAIAIYNGLCNQGLMQNASAFQNAAQSQNQGNGVVALMLPFYLADQLFVVALDIQFSTP